MFKIENETDLINILEGTPSDIFQVRFRSDNNIFSEYKEVIQNYNIDFFKLVILSLNQVENYQITRILIKLIPYSKLNIETIINFYREFYVSQNGTANYFSITKTIAEVDCDVAKRLLRRLLDLQEEFTVHHIAAILSVLHNKYDEKQYSTIIDFLQSDDELKILTAISHIDQFNFSKKEFQRIFELFKDIVKLSNKEIDEKLLYSSLQLIEKGYEYFSEIILLYMDNTNLENKYHLSQILMFIGKSHNHTEWFKTSFLSLSNIDMEHQHITQNIQFILNELLEKNDFGLISEFLYAWVDKSDMATKISNKSLDYFIPDFNKSIFFSKFITEALNLENEILHKFISSIILEPTELDADVMYDFSIEDFIFVCRKVLGYFYQFDIMNSMIFSILSVKNIPSGVKNTIIDILVNHIGKNYPHDTLEYYKKLDESSLNENEREATHKIVIELEKRNKQIQNLPLLKELLSASSQNRLISRTQSIAMSKAMKEAQKSSLWAAIGSNEILISHGRGWFSEDYEGNICEVSHLKSFSHSVIMPNASRSHPVHFEYERFQFRMIKKGEK